MSPTMPERVASLESNFEYLKEDLDLKHNQNRNSIDHLAGGQKRIEDSIWQGSKVQLAGWSTAAGEVL